LLELVIGLDSQREEEVAYELWLADGRVESGRAEFFAKEKSSGKS
jgi:hypothetical protein